MEAAWLASAVPSSPASAAFKRARQVGTALDAALALDHEDARLSDRMGDMFRARGGVEHVTRLEEGAVLLARFAISHLDPTIEDREHLFPVVDMPPVGLIRPVQARGDAVHVRYVDGAPRSIGLEAAAAEDFHAVMNLELS